MTSRDDIGALLAAWFDEDTTVKAPSWLLPATLARTSRVARRPRWLTPGLWLPPTVRDRRPLMLVPAAAILVALLLLAVVAAYVGSRPDTRNPLGVEGVDRIVLVGPDGIASVAADGSDRRLVTAADGHYGFPTWSPDGSRIAVHRYGSTEGRYTGNLVILSTTEESELVVESSALWMSRPSWSLDGRTIAYSTIRVPGQGHRIALAAADGSGVRVLGDETSNDWGPAFSPDGSRIAFVRQSGPQDAPDFSVAPPMDLYVMDADGSNVVRLSKGDFDWFDGSWHPFEWSPDGTRIVFTAGREGRRDIYVVSADGTQHERVLTAHVVDEGAPTWSPDGTRVAFYRYDPGSAAGFATLVVMNVETGARNALHTSSLWTPPLWTGDGRLVAATVADDGRTQTLVLLDAAGEADPVPLGPAAMAISSPDQPGLVEPVSLQPATN